MRHFVSYESIVEEAARDFFNDNTDMLIEAIVENEDFDRNDIRDLDRAWHEQIVDRAYSVEDAAFIIRNSNNVETDRGLTEGMDHEDAQSATAAWTHSNDVWEAAEKLYKDVASAVEDAEADITIDDDRELEIRDGHAVRVLLARDDGDLSIAAVFDNEDDMNFEHVVVAGPFARTEVTKDNIDNLKNLTAATKSVVKEILDNDGTPSYDDLQKAFRTAVATVEINAILRQEELTPIEPGSQEERTQLLEWMRAGRNSSRGGYPLGGSYIDARCGTLWGTPEHAYVVSDQELGRRLPHLRGKTGQQVKDYWNETFGGPAPETPEDMLAKVRQMIRDNADNHEFREIAGEIDAVLGKAAPRI